MYKSCSLTNYTCSLYSSLKGSFAPTENQANEITGYQDNGTNFIEEPEDIEIHQALTQ